ncbi:MAG: hypothetical protein MI867_14610 [Pseudomonadales bacterium]|nr:hypothetical protein [Pseudomonadales bacterium]
MTIIDSIAHQLTLIAENTQPAVVAIAGAADLGKSTIANQLAGTLSQSGVPSSVLSLDSYLMNRCDRMARDISGYQPQAYQLHTARSDIESWWAGSGIKVATYDHERGEVSGEEVIVPAGTILIVEGLHAMHELLIPLVHFSIFLETDDQQLTAIRLQADFEKRNQTLDFARRQAATEMQRYKCFVAPYQQQANLILRLVEPWDYQITHVESSMS